MNIVSVILAIIRLADRLVRWARRRELIDLGHAKAIAEAADELRRIANEAAKVEEFVAGMDEDRLRKELDSMYRD